MRPLHHGRLGQQSRLFQDLCGNVPGNDCANKLAGGGDSGTF